MTRRKHTKITINSLKSQQVKTKETYKLIKNLEKKKDELEHQQNILKIKKFNNDSIFDTHYKKLYEKNDSIYDMNYMSRLQVLLEHCRINYDLFNIFKKIKYIKNNDNYHKLHYEVSYDYLMDYYKETQYIEPFCNYYLQNNYLINEDAKRICQKLIKLSKEIKKNMTDYLHNNYGFVLFKTNTDCYQKILEYILPSYINKNNKINLTHDKKLQLPKMNISSYYKSEYKEKYEGKQQYIVIPDNVHISYLTISS